MLLQFFNEITKRNSFNRNFRLSQTNDYLPVIYFLLKLFAFAPVFCFFKSVYNVLRKSLSSVVDFYYFFKTVSITSHPPLQFCSIFTKSGVLGSIPGRATYFRFSSWVRYPVWQHTLISPSAFSRRAVVSYWRKYVHEVLVNRLRGLSLPGKSVVRLTDRFDMTLDVYRGRKTTMQQQQQSTFTQS